MNNYYTSVEIVNEMFIGTIFNSKTNQPLYKTKPYTHRSQATQDIYNYLKTEKPPTSDPSPKPQTITNKVVHPSGIPTPTHRRCCGR